jgi:hypothetical protein
MAEVPSRDHVDDWIQACPLEDVPRVADAVRVKSSLPVGMVSWIGVLRLSWP